jgi:hypothetical protein
MVSEQDDINGFQTFCSLVHQEGGLYNRVGVCFFSYFFRRDYETGKKKVVVAGHTMKRLCGRRRAFNES